MSTPIIRKAAEKASFAAVPETCPHIDNAEANEIQFMQHQCEIAINRVVKSAKQKTYQLRDALTEAHERILELEESLEDAKNEIKKLKSELEEHQ